MLTVTDGDRDREGCRKRRRIKTVCSPDNGKFIVLDGAEVSAVFTEPHGHRGDVFLATEADQVILHHLNLLRICQLELKRQNT